MATTSKNARSSAEPNVLHKFASYNTLFTLSALSTRELRNPKQFFEGKPHDIIVQSGGIGPDANRHEGPPSEQGQRFSAQTKATQSGKQYRIIDKQGNLMDLFYP